MPMIKLTKILDVLSECYEVAVNQKVCESIEAYLRKAIVEVSSKIVNSYESSI